MHMLLLRLLNTVIEESPLHVSYFNQEGRGYGWASFLSTVLATWYYSAALFSPGYT